MEAPQSGENRAVMNIPYKFVTNHKSEKLES
jgi:hypothetical protein